MIVKKTKIWVFTWFETTAAICFNPKILDSSFLICEHVSLTATTLEILGLIKFMDLQNVYWSFYTNKLYEKFTEPLNAFINPENSLIFTVSTKTLSYLLWIEQLQNVSPDDITD